MRTKYVRHGLSELNMGADYTPEEVAYLQAVDRYRRKVKRNVLRTCEYLTVLLQMGYVKKERK